MILGKKEGKVLNLGNFENQKIVCLTVDIEQDFGDLLAKPSYEGLERITEFIDFFKPKLMPLTCFVQGSLLDTHRPQIKKLFTLDADFQLHSYSHPLPNKRNINKEIQKAKKAYEDFFSYAPIGYRAPCGVISQKDFEVLAICGFKFDSSIFPSIRPASFNNLKKPLTPYFMEDFEMVEIPLTVFSSLIRIPISLSYIKLFGWPYYHLLKNFRWPKFVVFNFHLHDLFLLDSSNQIQFQNFSFPYRMIFKKIYESRKMNGLSILADILSLLRDRNYKFIKMINLYKEIDGHLSFKKTENNIS